MKTNKRFSISFICLVLVALFTLFLTACEMPGKNNDDSTSASASDSLGSSGSSGSVDGETCDHTVLKSAVIDLSTYGICKGTIEYATCECGEKKFFDTKHFVINCNLENDNYKEELGTDENGNKTMTITAACSNCGLEVKAASTIYVNGCEQTTVTHYSFYVDGAAIIADIVEESTYASHQFVDGVCVICGEKVDGGDPDECDHGTLTTTTVRLEEYGACAGYITYSTCTICKAKLLDRENFKVSCDIDNKEYYKEETSVDENGDVITTITFSCPTCSMAVSAWTKFYTDGCTITSETHCSFYINGETIAEDLKYTLIGTSHSFVDGVCSNCGEKGNGGDITECKHEWSEWENKVEPTCIDSGIAYRSCLKCGNEEMIKTDIAPHDYDENGSCRWCGKIEGECDHKTNNVVKVNFADYGACKGGVEYQVCDCGENRIATTSPYSDCDFQPVYGKPSTDENGNTVMLTSVACSKCGLTNNFSYTQTQTDSCNIAIEGYLSFSINGKVIIENLYYRQTVTSHLVLIKYELMKNSCDDGWYEIHSCDDCGLSERISGYGHKFDGDVCVICGENQNGGDITECRHDWSQWEVTRDPSCKENGIQIRHRYTCGEKEEEYLPLLDHVYVEGYCELCGRAEGECDHQSLTYIEMALDEMIYPICQGGLISYHTCDCGQVKNLAKIKITCDSENSDRNDNTSVDENGNVQGTVSARCNACGLRVDTSIQSVKDGCEMKTYTYYSLYVNDTVLVENVEQVTVEDMHIYPADGSNVCMACGKVVGGDVDVCNHEWSEWSVTIAPNCYAHGVQERYCLKCKFIETQDISPSHVFGDDGICINCGKGGGCNHKWIDWWQTIEATCQITGMLERHCELCGIKEVQEIEKLDHFATEEGFCHMCGMNTGGGDVDVCNHEWSEWSVIIAPTCYAHGVQERYCLKCKFIETQDISPIHVFGDNGICINCGEGGEGGGEIGCNHEWGEWVRVSEPTCSSYGREESSCINCGTVQFTIIDCLPHEYPEGTFSCVNCGAAYECNGDNKHFFELSGGKLNCCSHHSMKAVGCECGEHYFHFGFDSNGFVCSSDEEGIPVYTCEDCGLTVKFFEDKIPYDDGTVTYKYIVQVTLNGEALYYCSGEYPI